MLWGLAGLSLLDGAVASLHAGRAVPGDLWIPAPGSDFYDYLPRFPYRHQQFFFTARNAFPWVYPAPAIFVLYPFYLVSAPTRWHLGYALFASLALALSLGCATRLGVALRRRGLSTGQVILLLGSVLICGWPIYFALQRGNIEVLLWVGIAGAISLIATGRTTAGALLLGVVGSVKTYPLLFIGLLLLKRRYWESALAVLSALATTLLALRFLEPNVADASTRIRTGVAQWTAITTSHYFATGVGPDHSLLGLLRQCTLGAILRPPHALPIFLAAEATLAAAVFFLRIRHMPMPNQTLFLTCAAILLPPTSYDYTLLVLLIPWGWMVLLCVERARGENTTQPMTGLFVLFAFALAPLTFFHTHGAVPVRFEGPARCVALLCLAAYAAAVPSASECSR